MSKLFWKSYFLEAGILVDFCEKYATMFRKHRIRPSMLEDLDKGMLRDMGVTAMGDIICIMRYAKLLLDNGELQMIKFELIDNDQHSADMELPLMIDEEKGNDPSHDQVVEDPCLEVKDVDLDSNIITTVCTKVVPESKSQEDGEDISSASDEDHDELLLNADPLSDIEHDLKISDIDKQKSSPCRRKIEKSSKEERKKTDSKNNGKIKSKVHKVSKKEERRVKERRHHNHLHKDKKISKRRRERSESPFPRKHKVKKISSNDNEQEERSSPRIPWSRTNRATLDNLKFTVSDNKETPPLQLENSKDFHLAMIYSLDENNRWHEISMGIVHYENRKMKCTSMEDDNKGSFVIMECEILPSTTFSNSKETFMSWTCRQKCYPPTLSKAASEEHGHGIRFKDINSFRKIWRKIDSMIKVGVHPLHSKCQMDMCIKGDGPLNGISYGLASVQGWRSSMEDKHVAHITLPKRVKLTKNFPFEGISFFGVFDGHGGQDSASYAHENLLETILSSVRVTGRIRNGTMESEGILLDAITRGHLNLDKALKAWNQCGESGSTAVSLIIHKDKLFLSNLGDSRAILIDQEGKVLFATNDHKPMLTSEMTRIYANGGNVSEQRINGCLAVSRGFGDFRFKVEEGRELVIAEPDVNVFNRKRSFVVLASDGVWDVIRNDEIADIITIKYQEKINLKKIGAFILETCLQRGSRDNCTILIVQVH